jgi:hypothetical protein
LLTLLGNNWLRGTRLSSAECRHLRSRLWLARPTRVVAKCLKSWANIFVLHHDRDSYAL